MTLALAILKWLLVAAAVVYLGGLAVLYLKQRDLLFPAPPVGRTAPAAAGLPDAEEHVLTTADGEKVIVWHVPAKPGRPVVLFFPGNGDFLAGRVARFKAITADGTGLVALSYRGYAGSSGSPSEQGLLQDAAAAYAFTTARYRAEQIVAWGFSLGTGVAVALAASHQVGGVVLEAPFTSAADVGARVYWFLPVQLLMRDAFRSDRRIGQVKAPLLIMHGGHDNVVPISLGERLFSLANEPKQFVRFAEGAHHDLDLYGGLDAVRRFMAQIPP